MSHQLYLGNSNTVTTFTTTGNVDIRHNDEVIDFLRDNNLPNQYNDGLYQYLKALYYNDNPTGTFTDLMRRHIKQYGNTLQSAYIPPTTPAILLYDAYPASLTKQNASQFVAGAPSASYYVRNGGPCPNDAAVVCWQRFTGTDPVTGFAYPSFSPLFAYAGGVIEGFGMYAIDQYFGMGNPGSQAGYDAVIGVTTESNVVNGKTVSTIKTNHYNHVQNDFQSGVQSHFILYRNTSATGFIDLDTCNIDTWIRIPSQATLLNSTYKFRVIHDYKTSGDFRYTVTLIYADATDAAAFGVAVGTIGVMVTADNSANGGLPFTEFIRMKSYSVSIPTDFFKSTIYFNRATSYSDTTSGRFIYRINDQTVFDINPNTIAQYNIDHPAACTGNSIPTNCINRHMGINGNPLQRLFLVSNYFGGIGGNDVQFDLARLSIWNDAPFVLPSI